MDRNLRVEARAVGNAVSVEVFNGLLPITVTLVQATRSRAARTFAFMDVAPGTHRVRASDSAGSSASAEVTVS